MVGVRNLVGSMTPRGRLTVAGAVIGVLLVGFLLMRFASRPSYTMLMSGLDPAQTGRVTQALDQRGIRYELRDNGTALAVDKAKSADARIALATAGLSAAGRSHPTFDLVTKQKLGASSFQQQVAYQQALEGSLASTIEQIQGVPSADVRLVLPKDQLFQDSSTPATAAVLLGGDGDTMDPATVRGIAQLVASSVQGLKPSSVTITDRSGRPLWPSGSDAVSGDGGTPRLAAQARYAQALESNIDAMLVRTLGPNKASVQVNADLNLDEGTREQLAYDAKGVPLERKQDSETLTGKGASGASGGASGAAGNIPPYAQGAAAGGNSNYKHSTTTETLGVGKTVTKTKVAPGEVKRLGVALMLDASVPQSQVAGIQQAVSNAAGVVPSRGDTLSVTRVPFAKAPKGTPGASPLGGIMGSVKYVLLALASLAFLAFVVRHIRRAERNGLGSEPVWLRELDGPRPLAELVRAREGHADPGEPLSPEEAEAVGVRRRLDGLVREDPERVAVQLRTWMQED
jgi:flagellar M-ring protein FliF